MSWPLVKLGEIAPSKPIRANRYNADDLVWQITLDHIEANTGVLLEKNIRPYSEAGSSTHGFDNRYVLYSKLRPYLNKVLLPDEEGICTTELVPMLPNQKTLDRNYLAHYLKSREFVNWISAQTAGAKMPRVSMDVFWNHEIPLPPLEEQKRIAAILDKADAIRRKRQQAIKLADDFLRSVFLEMFGDPVTNPKGWEVRRIGDFLSVKNGYAFKSEYFSDDGDFVLLTPGNFYEKGGYRDRGDKQKFYSGPVPDGFILKAEDILLAMTEQAVGLLGSSLVVPSGKSYLHNQRLGLLMYDREVLKPEFLFYLFNSLSVRKVIHSGAIGLKVRHTSTKKIEEIEIGFPDFRLQEKFSNIVEKTKPSIEKMDSLNFSSAILFNSLSQKAFSGAL